MSDSTNIASNKKKKKLKKAFNGIAIGIFADNGPNTLYNHSKIPKYLINRLVIHGMSAVHGGEDMIGGLYGPLPMFERVTYRYLIYSFKVKATQTKDPRIAKHGRTCSVFLLFRDTEQRFVLNNHLTIEDLLIDYTNEHWNKELDISKDSVLVLYKKLNELVEVKRIRTFSFGEAGLIEFADPQVILDEGIISIIDIKSKTIYLYLPKDNFDSRMRIKAIAKMEEINLREFGSQLDIKKLRDYLKFKKIVDKFSIQLVK